MKRIWILKGTPNAGKSTIAKFLAPDYAICTADDYHYDKNGNYNFKFGNLKKAHESCRLKFSKLIEKEEESIVVANTNIKPSEYKFYVDLAEKNGYMIFYLVVERRHKGDNGHRVPLDTIKKMEQNLRDNIKLS